jgi:hypothetical protein
LKAPPTGQHCNQETAISANRLSYDISIALELDGANNVNSCKDIVVQYRRNARRLKALSAKADGRDGSATRSALKRTSTCPWHANSGFGTREGRICLVRGLKGNARKPKVVSFYYEVEGCVCMSTGGVRMHRSEDGLVSVCIDQEMIYLVVIDCYRVSS